MAGSKTDYLEKKILDYLLGSVAFTPPTTYYVVLSTSAYSEAATGSSVVEPSGGAYVRQSIANNATTWPAATGTSPTTKANGIVITFPTATGSWGTLLSWYLADAASAGNLLYGGDLGSSTAISTGQAPSFAIGALVVTED